MGYLHTVTGKGTKHRLPARPQCEQSDNLHIIVERKVPSDQVILEGTAGPSVV